MWNHRFWWKWVRIDTLFTGNQSNESNQGFDEIYTSKKTLIRCGDLASTEKKAAFFHNIQWCMPANVTGLYINLHPSQRHSNVGLVSPIFFSVLISLSEALHGKIIAIYECKIMREAAYFMYLWKNFWSRLQITSTYILQSSYFHDIDQLLVSSPFSFHTIFCSFCLAKECDILLFLNWKWDNYNSHKVRQWNHTFAGGVHS